MRPRRFIAVERLEHTARTALIGGYGTIATFRDTGTLRRQVHLHCAMDCERPYEFELHARYSGQHGKRVLPLTVVVHSRCRKCEPCRRRRSVFWQARAMTEFVHAKMTLFGTITIDPHYDAEFDARSRLELAESGVDFDRLPPVEMFRERVRQGGVELTKFLKRVRAGDKRRSPPDCRYLLVAEAHNSGRTSDAKRGRPHWHVLLHEQSEDARLVLPDEWARRPSGDIASDKYGGAYLAENVFLKQQWRLGFSSWALCRTPQAAGYLCKYLTKEDTNIRIRASFRYGTKWNENANESEPVRSDAEQKEKIDAPPKELGETGLTEW